MGNTNPELVAERLIDAIGIPNGVNYMIVTLEDKKGEKIMYNFGTTDLQIGQFNDIIRTILIKNKASLINIKFKGNELF